MDDTAGNVIVRSVNCEIENWLQTKWYQCYYSIATQ